MSENKKTDAKSHKKINTIAKIIALIILLGVVASLLTFRSLKSENLLSDDAVIQANVVHISAAIPGVLSEIWVKEGARVKQGDVLFRLERDVYELRLKQAQAELIIAQAALNTKGRAVKAESVNAVIAQEQITRAQTNLALTQRTTQRLRPLVAQGYATQQELDTAVTLERDAQVSLEQARSQAQAAQYLIGNEDSAQALVAAAQATVEIAQKALNDTEVKAPHNGVIVGLRVSTGERLLPDQSLFTLIDTDSWYAQALYLETELAHLSVGTCASVYALADPSKELQGQVSNIGWGVNSEDVLNLPRGLPFVQKSLNWVRVAQRFPVRIKLLDPPEDLMRMGASATVAVRVGQSCP